MQFLQRVADLSNGSPSFFCRVGENLQKRNVDFEIGFPAWGILA